MQSWFADCRRSAQRKDFDPGQSATNNACDLRHSNEGATTTEATTPNDDDDFQVTEADADDTNGDATVESTTIVSSDCSIYQVCITAISDTLPLPGLMFCDNSFDITIRSFATRDSLEKQFSIRVRPSETVHDVKIKIDRKIRLPPENQFLCQVYKSKAAYLALPVGFNTRMNDDYFEYTVEDCKIVAGSELKLYFRKYVNQWFD